MTSCSAYQAACQSECRSKIPFWKFGERQRCQQDCDTAYAQCYAELSSEAEDTSNSLFASQNETVTKIIIITIILVIIIFLVFLWLKSRKK